MVHIIQVVESRCNIYKKTIRYRYDIKMSAGLRCFALKHSCRYCSRYRTIGVDDIFAGNRQYYHPSKKYIIL